MEVTNTSSEGALPSTLMLVYGAGGVGKTTFAASAPGTIIGDCENGTKFLGLRGISVDVAKINEWADAGELLALVKEGDYKTVVIDPIGEFMEKAIDFLLVRYAGERKYVQSDGGVSMAGWGKVKEWVRNYVKALRSAGCNVLLVAHVNEDRDGDSVIKRPKIATRVWQDLIELVDVVGYMTMVRLPDQERPVRVIVTDAESDKFMAKDRTSQLPRVIRDPDFGKICEICQGKSQEAK